MKVHVSENTKILLDEFGGFILEKRGNIEIKVENCPPSNSNAAPDVSLVFSFKGKGSMNTYWLIGHDELPPPDQLASMGMEEIFESVFEPEFLQNI